MGNLTIFARDLQLDDVITGAGAVTDWYHVADTIMIELDWRYLKQFHHDELLEIYRPSAEESA